MTHPRRARALDRSIVEGPLSRAVWMLAWPTMLQNLIGGLQGMVDHALVGHLVGYAGNAAIGVAIQIFIVVIVFVMSVFSGMGVLVARFAGASGHILTAAKLIGAAKGGDTAAVTAASAQWYANADSIAAFLSAANPRHWPAGAMRSAMRMHLDLTLKEAVARLHGDWAADIAAYDEVHRHILQMADVLSDGIVKQFPSRFN